MNEQEKTCANCDHCVVGLSARKESLEAFSAFPLFTDAMVRKIYCAKQQWPAGKAFTSMAVFAVSPFPKAAAKECPHYSPEEE